MRAIRVERYGGPEVLRLKEVEALVPAPGQILVEVRAAGVNPVDTYLRSGSQGYAPQLPFTPGLDGAGVVLEAPDGEVAPGTRVYCGGSISGTYGEQMLCRTAELHRLPDELSFVEGACLFVPGYTAWRALFEKGEARPGQTLLIHGASGAVGSLALQLAVDCGMRVIATAGSEAGRAGGVDQGATLALDHGDPDHFRAIMDATEGRGVDLVVEMAAHLNLAGDLTVLASGGRVVVVGSRGETTLAPRELMRTEGTVTGVRLLSQTPAERARAEAGLHAAVRQGAVRPAVREVVPLHEAARAHQLVMTGPAAGNLVLVP